MRNVLLFDVAGRGFFAVVLAMIGFTPDVGFAQNGPKAARMIEIMDADGDGRISRSEWLRRPRAFNRIDRDGDGYATAEELSSFLQTRVPGGSGAARGSRAGGGRTGKGATMGSSGAGARVGVGSATAPTAPTTAALEIIDTHVHLGFGPKERDFDAGIAEALSKMPQRHVALAILLPTPQLGTNENKYDVDELRDVGRSDQFRLAGGSSVLGEYLHAGGPVSDDDKEAFRGLAQSMVDQGIVAFGEIGLFHYAVPRSGNVFGSVPLDHPLLDILGEVAAKSGIPIDVHFDVVPRSIDLPRALQGVGNPAHLEANLSQFEQFLSRNRKTKIVWAHVGFEVTPFRTTTLCETLLRRYKNLFMSIRLTHGGPNPSSAMDRDGNLKPDWKRVFTSFPDRFVFGSESMYGSAQSGRFNDEFILYQKLLAQLPPSVAQAIATSNARAIYRLGPAN